MSVLVILERRGDAWNRVSFEAVTAGQKLSSGPANAAVLGAEIGSAASEATQYGFEKVYAVESPALQGYTPEGYTAALEQLIKAVNPTYVLLPHTYQVRDYAPKLATRLGKPFISDVIEIETSGGSPSFVRQLFQGKLSAEVRPEGDGPHFISLQAGAFRAAQAGTGTGSVEQFSPSIQALSSKPEAPFREAARSVDLNAADIIVAVGRGIKEKDNLPVVEELATALGAELAASRPICDNGWLPMERQVGSSGQTVSPKVYVAVGISGAIQHLVGMKGAKTVVAINKDENAPIFEVADYGVVGDLFEVVPALVQELKKAKS